MLTTSKYTAGLLAASPSMGAQAACNKWLSRGPAGGLRYFRAASHVGSSCGGEKKYRRKRIYVY